jgi:EAL and modified HD-GYP domain-containing signal transduction protein
VIFKSLLGSLEALLKMFSAARQQRDVPPPNDILGDWMEAQWAPSRADAFNRHYVALQPIFNRRGKIFGYETLARSGWNNRFDGDSDAATRTMVENWTRHRLDRVTERLPVFLNCTREALVDGILTQLPRTTVLELLETIVPDDEILSACRKMKALGFKIALDDFQFSEKMRDFIDLADYIKVDFRISDKEERRELLRRLRNRRAILIAEKIETIEEFESAIEEGFQLFQGYYLGYPTVYSKRKFPPRF